MRRIALVLAFVFCLTAKGQQADTCRWKIRNSIGLDVRPSYSFSSYRDDILRDKLNVDNAEKSNLVASLHLKYGFTFAEESSFRKFFPESWQGIGAAVNFLGNPRGAGNPIDVYLFQGAPILKLCKCLSVYYEWNFGASFGWRPCDGETAYSNLIVGSKVNAYINLGAGLRWRLNNKYTINTGVSLTHFSNGNTSFPNPGVNMVGICVGVLQSIGNMQATGMNSSVCIGDSVKRRHKLQFDVTAYGGWRKRVYRGGDTPVLLNGHYTVVGFDVAPMLQIKNTFRAGGSFDLQWDQSTNLKKHYAMGSTSDDIRFYRPSVLSQICVGVSGRAELVMPIFSVNVGMGYNFIGPEETRATYQLANLKVRFTERFFLNVGYQLLNFQKQNNLMLGIGYSLH